MRVLAIINQKGGCGKTTTAINLAGAFARRGYRTLLVDMDPQSHCAAGLAIPEQRIDLDIGDAMLSAHAVDPSRLLWRAARNLDLAPSRTKLAGLEAMRGGLADKADKEKRLSRVLDALAPSYEVCIVDCSPSIGLLTYNAMTAADAVLIPVETSFFSLQGATKQVHTVRSLSKRLGVPFACWLLGTIHDAESPLAKDLLEELRRRFASRVAPVVVHRDDAIREAASFGQPVIEYAPSSRGARDYFELAEWLVGRHGLQLDAPSSTDPLQGAFEEIEPDPEVEVVSTAGQEAGIAKRVADSQSVSISRAEDLKNRARAMSRREDIAGYIESDPKSFGVRQHQRELFFTQPLGIGREVAIAGAFNDWNPSLGRMRENESKGQFEYRVQAPPGRHEYRIVVDGHWIADPYNEMTIINPYGEPNSIAVLKPEVAEPQIGIRDAQRHQSA